MYILNPSAIFFEHLKENTVGSPGVYNVNNNTKMV